MAGGSPRRQSPGRRAAGGARGCLLLVWAAAAAAVFWASLLSKRSSGGFRLELLGRSRDASSGGNAGAVASGSPAVTPAALEVGALTAASPAPSTAQPQHKFLIFFSGHQGSSALADMLAQAPAVFVPGFEPLDVPGLSPEQKLAFLEATFAFPPGPAAFPAWRAALTPPLPGLRVDRQALQSFGQLAGKTVAGFKLRPYALSEEASQGGYASAVVTRGHTAAAGLPPGALRALLRRHNVSVLLTLRRNALKEALSWHKARDLGRSQFTALRAACAAAGLTASLPAPPFGGLDGGVDGGGLGRAGAPAERLAVNISRVHHWLDFTARVNAELRRAAAFHGRPTLTLWYEDFLADPLREARRAAGFVGVPPPQAAALAASAKFVKAGPDAIQGWVANFGELCRALQGGPHYQHLDATACSAALAGDEGSSTGSVGGTDGGSSGARVGDTPVPPAAAEGAQPLRESWCLPQDRAAAGWSDLSAAQCQTRYRARQAAAEAAVRGGSGLLLFKHVHKAGGTTLCKLALANGMAADAAPLPARQDWDTNCVPYEAFLGPHPAVGDGTLALQQAAAAGTAATQLQRRRLGAAGAPWLGGACWLAFRGPPQLRALAAHFAPLTFVASEGPLPDEVPLDALSALGSVTMLRRPPDRALSSYRWWRIMLERMPSSPANCHAYSAPSNATLEQWLEASPDNWVTRELLGRSALYGWRQQPLTAADLAAAQARLHLFSAVLILERPATSMAALRDLFGWRETGWEAHRSGSRLDGSDAAAQLEPGELAALRQRNQWDERLYDYAVRLHEAQAAARGWPA